MQYLLNFPHRKIHLFHSGIKPVDFAFQLTDSLLNPVHLFSFCLLVEQVLIDIFDSEIGQRRLEFGGRLFKVAELLLQLV